MPSTKKFVKRNVARQRMRNVHNSMKSLKKLHTKFSKDVCAMVGFVFYGHFFGENTCDCG